ncbi:hypothetical protein [Macrococcus equi]|uniref:hypothetical protein n=1 Tax=Macrococcus equi TaxID=3395462 RepID=UPI0039BE737A
MKKIISLSLIMLFSLLIVTPQLQASTYALKSKYPVFPNLYSYSNAKAMKSASFKYYGLKLRQNYPTMIKQWGKPSSSTVTRSFGYTAGSYFYGLDNSVLVSTMAKGEKASSSRFIIDSFTISKINHSKYELSKVNKYFGKPTSTTTSGNYKVNDYGNYVNITFTKVGSKWYVDTLNLHRYSFQ